VTYRLPGGLRERVRGKTIAVVDDVINAGSAVRGTLAELRACGATPMAVGALLVLGSAAASLCACQAIPWRLSPTFRTRYGRRRTARCAPLKRRWKTSQGRPPRAKPPCGPLTADGREHTATRML